MENGKSKAGNKSLLNLDGEIVYPLFENVRTLPGSGSRDRDNQDLSFESLASGSSRDGGQSSSETLILGNPTGAQHAQDAPVPEFSRSLGPDWIDIEMMGTGLVNAVKSTEKIAVDHLGLIHHASGKRICSLMCKISVWRFPNQGIVMRI
jgi:hypothetical protein